MAQLGEFAAGLVSEHASVLKVIPDQTPLKAIVSRGGWILVGYQGAIGWVESSRIQIRDNVMSEIQEIESGQENRAFDFSGSGSKSGLSGEWLIVVSIICILSALSVAGAVVIRRLFVLRKTLLATPESGKHPRSAYLYADHEILVQRSLTHLYTSLRLVLTDLGFAVTRFTDFNALEKMVAHNAPQLLVIDVCKEDRMIDRTASMMVASNCADSTVVVFYNIPQVEAIRTTCQLSLAFYIGDVLNDRDVINAVAPGTQAVHVDETASHKTVWHQPAAFEGTISHGQMGELFQYLEVSRKSGCLMVESNGTFGSLYLRNGKILYAATRKRQAKEAALAVLALTHGYYKFNADEKAPIENCLLSPTHLALMWAKDVDESAAAHALSHVRVYETVL